MGATMCYSCIILPEDPFSFFGNSVWKPGCPLETCTPRGLERDCGNTDADGARATRPRDGDGDGTVHLWMVWWIRHKSSGINSPYGGIIWNYDPYAIMVSEYSCYKPRTSRHSQFMTESDGGNHSEENSPNMSHKCQHKILGPRWCHFDDYSCVRYVLMSWRVRRTLKKLHDMHIFPALFPCIKKKPFIASPTSRSPQSPDPGHLHQRSCSHWTTLWSVPLFKASLERRPSWLARMANGCRKGTVLSGYERCEGDRRSRAIYSLYLGRHLWFSMWVGPFTYQLCMWSMTYIPKSVFLSMQKRRWFILYYYPMDPNTVWEGTNKPPNYSKLYPSPTSFQKVQLDP